MTLLPRETQPERTVLAENRTQASILVVSAVLLRVTAVRGSVIASIAAVLAVLAGFALMVLSSISYRRAIDPIELRRVPLPAFVSAVSVILISVTGLTISVIALS